MPNSSQTVVQIGFQEALNYPFVVSNALSTAQILAYTPECVAYALGLTSDYVLANSLRPYTMTGYTATVAYIIIPTTDLSRLETAWNDTTSALYNQDDSSLQSLVVLIDRSIPLLLSSTKSEDVESGTASSEATTTGSDPDAASYGSLADTGSSSSTSTGSVKKIAGIGIGSAAAAGAYASLMFLLARRYRSRRITLLADSAPPTATTGRGTAGDRWSALPRPRGPMFGTRQIRISSPMNAENSLGI